MSEELKVVFTVALPDGINFFPLLSLNLCFKHSVFSILCIRYNILKMYLVVENNNLNQVTTIVVR